MWELSFHEKFVFRSPALPFSATKFDTETVKKLLSTDKFLNALYIASPALYNDALRWLNNEIKTEKEKQKIVISLSKYISRIQTRCTPYGLFAGCGVGTWGSKDLTGFGNLSGLKTQSEIVLSDTLQSHTRLDMDYFCMLVKHLSKHPAIKPNLLFYPNNSIYSIGDEIRYVEYTYKDDGRVHTMKSVDKNAYALKVLEEAKNGTYLFQSHETLEKVDSSISKEDAENFLQQLIDSQLLISELEPAISGEEFMPILIKRLEEIHKQNQYGEVGEIILHLKSIEQKINSIDGRFGNKVNEYRNVFTQLKELKIDAKEKLTFQADAYYKPITATLNKDIQKKLLNVIGFLKRIAQPYQNPDLNNFKNKFIEKYEERKIPLLEALDKETGIGYPNNDQTGVNPLVEEFIFAGQQNAQMQMGQSYRDQFLLKKLTEAFKEEKTVINFKDDDLKDFGAEINANTTITMSLMFKVIDAQKNRIQLMLAGGNSSAANLLGRFAHGDKEIENIIHDIVAYEKKVADDRIVAEIIHLPQSRLGNIILRPVFRHYEIPYMGKSGVPEEFQIPLSDIIVSVRNNRIVLWSKRLNKEILPRLSTAHNYGYIASLPAYKFLGEMQVQDVSMTAVFFNWGAFSRTFKFLPRAEYDDVVLAPASWNLAKSDYEVLIKNLAQQDFMRFVKEWKEKWKMPRYILLREGDNELFVDLESELSVKTLLEQVKKRGEIELIEFLFDPKTTLVKDEKGNAYTNEIIALLYNKNYEKKADTEDTNKSLSLSKIVKKDLQPEIKRNFIPGSEWLFYKIYCGVKTADKILVKNIKPLVEELTRKGLIEKWFFIRYNDPDFHIRLRFYHSDAKKISEVFNISSAYFNNLQEQGVIFKIMNDTYVREIERYGHSSMELSEDYFCLESNSVINLLSEISTPSVTPTEDLKFFYAIRSIHQLLDLIGFSPGEKLGFMEFQKNNFIAEHGGHKELKLRLDEKFRDMRKKIEDYLGKKKDMEPDFAGIVNLLSMKRLQLTPIIKNILNLHEARLLETSLNSLLSSYLHMNINRIFLGKQRTYEMVIYDMLYRYYKSAIARAKKEKSALP